MSRAWGMAAAAGAQAVALGAVFLLGHLPLSAPWTESPVALAALAVIAAGAAVAAPWLVCRRLQRGARPQPLASLASAQDGREGHVPARVFRRVRRPDGRTEYTFVFGPPETAEDDAVLPDDRARWHAAVDASARDLKTYEFEYRIRDASGGIRWVWSRGVPTRGPDGSIAWDCLALDVTDRRRAEEELREREAMIQSIAAHVPGYIYRRVRRADGTYLLAHMSADPLGLLGVSMSELGVDSASGNANIHPDDRAARMAAIEQSARDMTPHNISFRRIRADGSVRWVRSAATPRRAENGDIIWDGIALDITDLKTAEQTLQEREDLMRGITARMPGYIYRRVRRADGTIDTPFISGGSTRLVGVVPNEYQVDAERSGQSVHPDDRALRHQAFEESARTLAPFNLEFRRMLPDGTVRWVRSMATPRRLDNGDVVWDGIAIDITDLKAAEQALGQSEEKFRVIADTLPTGIGIMRLSDGRSLYVNEAMQRQLGDASAGPSVLDPAFYGDESEREAVLRQLREHGQVNGREIHMRRRDGGEFWGALYARKVSVDGIPCVICGLVDMTDRRQAERALAESEAQLRAILDNAPIIISLKDPQGRYVMVNSYHDLIFGLSDTECVGHTAQEVFGPRIADLVSAVDEQVIAFGWPITFEIEVPTTDGTNRVMLETKFPVSRPDGTLIGLGTVGLDITDRKRSDQALSESEARFRALVENVPAMVSLKDAQRRYLLVNPRYRQWLGLQEADMLGFVREELPDHHDRERIVGIEKEVMDTGETRNFEVDLPRADGTTITTFQTKFPIPGPDGRPVALGTFAYDITDRKRAEAALLAAEERFRQFAESASDWMWETDVEHRFTYTSERRQAALGLPAETVLGRTWGEISSQPTDGPAWRRHRADLEARRPFRNFETAQSDAKGKLHVITVSGNPVFDADGAFQGYRGTARDVTEERDREAQLVQAQKMQAIGELTGGIAHDFNNLLGVVLTNLDLLAETLADDSEAARIVDRAVRATLRGADLTRGLVAFARKQSLRPVETDLNQLIVDLVEMLGRTLGETVQVRSDLAAELWPALIDRGQMESALVNLAVNARDAMPGGGQLAIETANVTIGERIEGHRFRTRPGDYVRLTVRDTGTGIDPEHLNRVFEPFFTTKEVGKGSGLGLSMVFGFVKQSDGYITIDSALGRGTAISLYLPRLVSADEEDGIGNAAAGLDSDLRGHGRMVLVVEDEDSVRQVVASILMSLGYRVIEARNGADAVAVLEAGGRPDLLFTDLVLPGGISGRDIAGKARELWPDLPILFTTGYTRDAENLTNDAGTGFLRKPFRKADLAVAVHRMIDYAASP